MHASSPAAGHVKGPTGASSGPLVESGRPPSPTLRWPSPCWPASAAANWLGWDSSPTQARQGGKQASRIPITRSRRISTACYAMAEGIVMPGPSASSRPPGPLSVEARRAWKIKTAVAVVPKSAATQDTADPLISWWSLPNYPSHRGIGFPLKTSLGDTMLHR